MNRERLEAAIAAQEALRELLGDEVVDTAVEALRKQVVALDTGGRRRRQVTVLFADVSGFTSMAERLDAEDVTDVMNEIWTRLDAVVDSHGGRIDKHIGDALMAVWGTGSAREDDPERAVRAALGFQRAMADFRMQTGSELSVRVGVNTGPAVLGAVGSTGEFTAMGDTVNLASRLEHAAPVDGVLISHDTYRHVKGVFTVRPQPPLEVKGKRRPVRTYVVHDVRPRAFRLGTRGVEGIETRMVGRAAELELLRTTLTEMLDDRTARVVGVSADAGLGKSRLLYEFEDWLHLESTDVRLFKARADEQHAAEPLFLIRDMLLSRFGIADDEAPEAAIDTLVDGIRELAPATSDSDVSVLAAIAGFDTEHETQEVGQPLLELERVSLAVAVFLNRVAAAMPIVVFLEDLHWADDASLEVVDSLMAHCADHAVFMAVLSRPGRLERHPLSADRYTCRIELVPLSDSATRELVEEVLQNVAALPDGVIEGISSTAAGNPFFVEELVKVMVDDEAIVIDEEGWTLDVHRLGDARRPTTIAAVLEARIDRLPAIEADVLTSAAVIGQTFWAEAVASIVDGTEPRTLAALLEQLESKELVFRQPSSRFVGTHQYIFKHALLRDVAYERVLKADRERLHRGVAVWLMERDGSDTSSSAIATHFESAGESSRAAVWHARAGRHAASRLAPLEAARHLTTARRSDALDPETRSWVLERLSWVLTLLARHDDGLDVAGEMLDVAAERGDPREQVGALLHRSFHLGRLGRLEEALAACERAMSIDVGGADGLQLRMQTHIEKGWISLRLGRVDDAILSGRMAISLDPEHARSRDLRGAHSQLGVALETRGDLAGAEHHLHEALRIDREEGDAYSEAGDLINLGVLVSSRREHELAISHYEDALRITREIGDVDQEALALNNLGIERIWLGDFSVARDQLVEALRLFESANAAEHTSETHSLLARSELGLGEAASALEHAGLALQMAASSGSADHLGNAQLTLAAIARLRGGPVSASDGPGHGADEWLTRGIATLTAAGLDLAAINALRQLARVVHDAGDPVGANELRRHAHEIRHDEPESAPR